MEEHRKENYISKELPTRLKHKIWHVVGMVMLCFSASFLGAWAFVGLGIVPAADLSKSIAENRDAIVSQEGEIVEEVFRKISPSTVAITTEAKSRMFINQGAGSGIIISDSGYIVTNKHVVEGSDSISVMTDDGRTYDDVKLVGEDPINDIAFLKVDNPKDFKPAELGDSDSIKPGHRVVAIGNALGVFQNSVTSGIVSGIGRPIQAEDGRGNADQLENLIQTDAAINPGNSGGPLVNLKGEVVGINTAISEEGQAIGFAIPINDARGVIDSVLQKGEVAKPYLGVMYITIDNYIRDEYKLSESEGAYVYAESGEAVIKGSPADKAGVQKGDIITKVADKKVGSTGLASLIARYKPGDKVELTIKRDGREIKLQVLLEKFSR